MSITLRSPAKLNWFLRVLEPRPDGYHDLETVFQELELADELTFSYAGDERCSIRGFPEDVPAETNLITRAWEQLRQDFPDQVSGIQVDAVKRLPRGGGLGGGSSNCAAALKAMNQLFDLRLSDDDLEMRGARLGSDVPFFVRGGCAIGAGRGELLTQVQQTHAHHLVLVVPPKGISTAAAFAHLDSLPQRPRPDFSAEDVVAARNSGSAEELAAVIYNDFEIPLAGLDWYEEICNALREAGVLKTFLCGSGSTVASLVRNAEESWIISKLLNKHLRCSVFNTRTA